MLKPYLIATAVLSVFSLTAGADGSILYCKGVSYSYPDGVGTGDAVRRADSRTVTLDPVAMNAGLESGGEVKTTQLKRQYGAYQGVFAQKRMISGTAVLAEQMEIDPAGKWVEMRYLLEDQRRFLSFTGSCNPE